MNPATAGNKALVTFLSNVELLGPAGRRDAIRAEYIAQGGDPSLQTKMADGFHIALFGLHACGVNEDDAVRQWICLTRTLMGGFPTPSKEPAMRVPQILWAMHIMGHWQTIPANHLRSACLIILTLSTNQILISRAAEIASACDFKLTTTKA
jgi:hypothetical protein